MILTSFYSISFTYIYSYLKNRSMFIDVFYQMIVPLAFIGPWSLQTWSYPTSPYTVSILF